MNELQKIIKRVETAIKVTPTGELRNLLRDVNIHLNSEVISNSDHQIHTKDWMLGELRNRKRVTHTLFAPHEWLKQTSSGKYTTETSVIIEPCSYWQYRQGEAWQTGWSLFD